MDIAIRKATMDDLKAISQLNKALFNFEEQFGHEYNLEWPFTEDGQAFFKKSLEKENYMTFVAELDKTVVGYIIAFIKSYPYRRVNPICEIANLFVKEDYRKHGVGKRLMDAVKDVALKQNVKRIRVGTVAQNTQALKFYRANGFEDTNVFLEMKINR